MIKLKAYIPSEAALHQIETCKYYKKHQKQGKEIILISIHISSKEQNIENLD